MSAVPKAFSRPVSPGHVWFRNLLNLEASGGPVPALVVVRGRRASRKASDRVRRVPAAAHTFSSSAGFNSATATIDTWDGARRSRCGRLAARPLDAPWARCEPAPRSPGHRARRCRSDRPDRRRPDPLSQRYRLDVAARRWTTWRSSRPSGASCLPRRRARVRATAVRPARGDRALKRAPGQIDLYAELTFHPLNTFVLVPTYTGHAASALGRPIEPRNLNRHAAIWCAGGWGTGPTLRRRSPAPCRDGPADAGRHDRRLFCRRRARREPPLRLSWTKKERR